MRASSSRNRAFALGWVLSACFLLALLAGAIWYLTSTTQANLGHALLGEAMMDLAESALAESLAVVRGALISGKPLAGRNVKLMFARDYPFTDLTIDPQLTRKLATDLKLSATIDAVTLHAVGRTPPGEEDPLRGAVDLTARVTTRYGALSIGREVSWRLVFAVPCGAAALPGVRHEYMRIHWGLPKVDPNPLMVLVKRL